MSSELIPRTTVDEVVGHRNKAVREYARARDCLRKAAEWMEAAQESVRAATAGCDARAWTSPHAPEIDAFNAARVLDPEQFFRVARRLTDIRVWASLIERTELDHLMDKQGKDELRAQMAYVPEVVDRSTGALINEDEIAKGLPLVTVETIQSTLEGFARDSGMIFRRGLSNAFSNLDRRFRSHDGFKIGSRVILSYAFDDWGSWNYHRAHRDTLTDIERVFLVLDGKGPRAAYAGIVGKVSAERKGMNKHQSEHEGDYFRVRIFKNGNAHLWFTRPELVEKANKLLAEHYGEVIADGKDRPEDLDAPLGTHAVTPAKDFGFFPTPATVADGLCDGLLYSLGDGARILEPSAGTGMLARRVKATDVVEVQPHLAEKLRQQGFRVRCMNFLTLEPEPVYDAVVMNPPFDGQRDIDHVWHAWHFLKPGGLLVAIMSAGTEFRENKKAAAFRKLMNNCGATWRDLPPGSFAKSGTMANALTLRVRKP